MTSLQGGTALNPELRVKKQKYLASQAELLKALSHPVRLCILTHLYQEKRSNVTDMQMCIDVKQSTVSQHLTKLKSAGVINGQREGTEIHYSIKNEEVIKILDLILDHERNQEV